MASPRPNPRAGAAFAASCPDFVVSPEFADIEAAFAPIEIELDDAPPSYADPARALRRGRRMGRALIRADTGPEVVTVFVREWARVVEQQAERLAGDLELVERLRRRAAGC